MAIGRMYIPARKFPVMSHASHRVAGLAVVLRHYGRKLLQRYVSREALPLVVKPGLGEKRIVVARTHRVILLPCGQLAVLWLPIHQHLRHTLRVSLGLLEHRELVGRTPAHIYGPRP